MTCTPLATEDFCGHTWAGSRRKRTLPLACEEHADFAKFFELRFLDLFDILIPTLAEFGMFRLGMLLKAYAPGLATNGPQMLIWGFFVSTVALIHGTCTIYPLSHVYSSLRHEQETPAATIVSLR